MRRPSRFNPGVRKVGILLAGAFDSGVESDREDARGSRLGHNSRFGGRRNLPGQPSKNTDFLDLEGISGGLGTKNVESVVLG